MRENESLNNGQMLPASAVFHLPIFIFEDYTEITPDCIDFLKLVFDKKVKPVKSKKK